MRRTMNNEYRRKKNPVTAPILERSLYCALFDTIADTNESKENHYDEKKKQSKKECAQNEGTEMVYEYVKACQLSCL